ncbi:Oidioi.mRNA.OKI2018_I69.XSR.g14118.t1.cds [Oikopleura dioica]|uniref:Oidioi.mRNA.OKI2018_I69.XSR.g14118.t1.cds n=1 Tax=Oikopleura dioica TaxID=34765 RepID=A0ABN7S8W7_OIKDI|nr:Oidioi.mRNA.OKI2018_I69.XSR.g14118.t1.cds [Oikopleura dioica]
MIIRDSTGAVKQEVVGELFLFVQDYPYYTYTRATCEHCKREFTIMGNVDPDTVKNWMICGKCNFHITLIFVLRQNKEELFETIAKSLVELNFWDDMEVDQEEEEEEAGEEKEEESAEDAEN